MRGAMGYLKKGPIPEPDLKLLLPPGLTISQIADRVAQLPGHTRDGFLKVVTSGQIRSAFEPAGVNSLEGLLFPDTYFIGPAESDESIVHKLVARFDEIANRRWASPTRRPPTGSRRTRPSSARRSSRRRRSWPRTPR